MDIDISDILAEAARPSHPHYASGRPTPYDSDSAYTDHQLLIRAWTSERCTPDLLPYPTELVQRVMDRVQSQIRRIEDLTSGMTDDSYSLLNGNGNSNAQTNTHPNVRQPPSNVNANLILSILQTDLSRTQFLLRSLLRQRLAKVAKFAPFYLKLLDEMPPPPPSSSSDNAAVAPAPDSTKSATRHRLLSPAETAFVRHRQVLLSRFYDASFFAGFPSALRRLDDGSGGVNMVEGPDGEAAVVVRCLAGEDEGQGQGQGWSNEEDLREGGDGDDGGVGAPSVEVRMQRGDVVIVRWRDVKKGVVEGALELL